MPKRQQWKPAATTKITKLPPNGPKPGQSVDAWLYGKTEGFNKKLDNPNTKFTDIH